MHLIRSRVSSESGVVPPSGHSGAYLFVYLGRSPAFASFVIEFAETVGRTPGLECHFVVADQTDLLVRLRELGVSVLPVATFYRTTPLEILSGYVRARRAIVDHLRRLQPRFVVTLMPHVWSPLLAREITALGIRYATVIHDALPHPGDPTAWATRWLARDADRADVVLTLSRFVARQLAERRPAHRDRVVSLFHPDLTAGSRSRERTRAPGRPFRLLFFGRIMAYKGLPQLVDAVELLRREGVAVELGVVGAGSLAGLQPRLKAIGAEVVNRWLQPEEVAPLLAGYDAMACHHIEASQSGVVALAFGNDLPVVATPIGGIAEQVIDCRTGVLAADISTRGFADAVRRLIDTPGLYDEISRNLVATSAERSMSRFVADLTRAVTGDAVPPSGRR